MPWNRETIRRLVEVEAQLQGVDPRLALAVAERESGFKPDLTSKAGAYGVMQLMPNTAKQLGVDPTDVSQNVAGGIRYFKQQLDAHAGDTRLALAAYNAGPGAVQRWKGVPPFKETQGYVSWILNKLGPARAEAATPAPAGRSRLEEIEAELARRDAQPPAGATTTPAPSAQPGASQGPLTPSPAVATPAEASATVAQMRQRQTPALARFLALPSIAQLTPAEREQVQAEFQALPPDQQEQVIQQEVPQDLTQAMEKPQASYPRSEGATPRPGEKRLGAPDEAPLEEGITKPSTMLPLVGGMAAPGLGAKAGMRLVPEAWRWLGRIGGETAVQAGTELGGRMMETGQAPSFKDIATTTAWTLAPQAGEELLRAVPRAILRSGQGARTILSDVAAQESKGLGRRVFHPQDEQVLSKMFEDVKASGVKLDIDPVTDLLTSLKPEQRQVLLRDVKTISSPLAAALQRTGQPGAPRVTGWDIGDLQTLRSDLIKRGQAVRTPERQDLIHEMRMAVDDAIENGMAVGSTAAGGNPETLKAAQAGWRRLKQSDDLQALVTKHTNYSPNLQYQDLNLAALKKSLEGTNPLGRKVAGSLGEAERTALQQELATLAKRYPFVKVPNTVMNIGGRGGLPAAGYLAITGNLSGAAVAASSAVVALALQSPKAMEIFRSAIVNGKGRLSSNDIAAMVNAVRQMSDVEAPG